MESSSFRLFISEFVKAGKDLAEKSEKRPHPRRLKSRRIYERFDLSYKHMRLLNDQDILIIRDLSERGFCCEVSSRAFKKFDLSQIYLASIRYGSETYKVRLEVSWKKLPFVGFACLDPSASLLSFMKRLLKPIAIGQSLKMVSKADNQKIFESDKGVKLTVFYDSDETLLSFLFENQSKKLEWTKDFGFSGNEKFASEEKDIKTFVFDIFMAMADPIRQKLLQTFESS